MAVASNSQWGVWGCDRAPKAAFQLGDVSHFRCPSPKVWGTAALSIMSSTQRKIQKDRYVNAEIWSQTIKNEMVSQQYFDLSAYPRPPLDLSIMTVIVQKTFCYMLDLL